MGSVIIRFRAGALFRQVGPAVSGRAEGGTAPGDVRWLRPIRPFRFQADAGLVYGMMRLGQG
jgi:hypothetical protein